MEEKISPKTDNGIPFIAKLIGTGFYSGYSPLIPGTAGSIVGLIIYMIPGIENIIIFLPLIIIFYFAGLYSSALLEKKLGDDPSVVVIDEIVGMWISLLFIEKSFPIIIAAFILFRLFDIFKPFPCRQLEKLPNGWGIMLDDVFAGIYTSIVIHIILFFIN